MGEAASTAPNTVPPDSAAAATAWCTLPSTTTKPRAGRPSASGASHSALDVGQRQRREGVAPGHDRAGRVERDQQALVPVALAVVGQEVADRGGIGRQQRAELREGCHQLGNQLEPRELFGLGRGHAPPAPLEIRGDPCADRPVREAG